MFTELLFSYGTLQLESVQEATFGRLLDGEPDAVTEFELAPLKIEDPHVIAVSGKDVHTVARFTGRSADRIAGVLYRVTAAEIERADDYEVVPCKRIAVALESGTRAWMYVDGRYLPPGLV